MTGNVEHLPANIAIVAGGLGRHGHWRLEGSYGWVWGPSVEATWRPYHDGHWVWVNPFGWTWCGNESWGWAPYHYGTWAHFGWGWGWCPGPYHQYYWSPAVVSFTSYNGDYCWTPLCPEEVFYPSEFRHRVWRRELGGSTSRIGGCGVFRPGFRDFFVFGRRDFDRHNWNDRFTEVGRFGVADNHFVPRNAAWGASAVSEHSFGQSSRFRAINGSANQYFERGHGVTSASHPFSGPVMATANRASMTPTHTFNSSERPSALDRPLYRAPVSAGVARSGEPFGRTINTGGASRRSGRSGSFGPSSGASSNVERARQSLGFSGRSSSSSGRSVGNSSTYDRRGDRNTQGATANSRGIERSMGSAGGVSPNVERARQSLGYSGRGNSGGSNSDGSSRGSNGRATSGNSGGSSRSDTRSSSSGTSYHYRGDSQSGYSHGSHKAAVAPARVADGAQAQAAAVRAAIAAGGSRGDSGSRGSGSRGDSGGSHGGGNSNSGRGGH